MTFAV